MGTRVLIVSGTTRAAGRTHAVAAAARTAAEAAGAEVRFLDLASTRLPLFEEGSAAVRDSAEAKAVRESAVWADGFVIVTPEYHGSMSGALKNWFDFLYAELSGKVAAVLATTGGGGGDMSITAVKTSFQWCHGFVLPFHAAAREGDFEDLVIVNPKVAERIERVARDVVRYAPVLRAAYEEARKLGKGVDSGFAGLHG